MGMDTKGYNCHGVLVRVPAATRQQGRLAFQVCMCEHMCEYACAWVNTCEKLSTYERMDVSMHVRMYVSMCIHV